MGSILMACSTEASDSSFDARGYSSTDKLVSAEAVSVAHTYLSTIEGPPDPPKQYDAVSLLADPVL